MQDSTNTYLLQNKKNLKDEKEVYLFLKKSFPDLQDETIYDTYFSFVFSLIAHICYPCSLNALTSVLGKDIIHRQKIKRLMDKGLLKTFKMTIQDKASRNAYYLSPIGTELLYSSLPIGLFEKTKVRRTGDLLPVHDYSLGLSLLQCLLRETPFSYQKEVSFASDPFTKKGILCVDAIVEYQDPHQTCFYIEQDMGTESPAVLARKLHHYDAYDLLVNKNTHLILSSHSMIDVDCHSYNASALTDLLKLMEEKKEHFVYTCYTAYEADLSPRLRKVTRAFLVRTGICNSYNYCGELKDASDIDDHDTLERNLKIPDFNREDLRFYVSSLKDGSNAYKEADYHRRQLIIAHRKLERVAQFIIRQISDEQFHRGDVKLLLNGHTCYVLPSVLLSNYFDMIITGNQDSVIHTLSGYFPGIKKAYYSYLSPEISYDGYPKLHLRNCYQIAADAYVCVEYVGKDLGSYVRAYYLNLLCTKGLDANIHVVCVCDTPKEALSLAALLNYFPKQRQIETKGIHYSFLLSHEIGTDEGICIPTRMGGGSLLPIKPIKDTSSPTVDQNVTENLSGLSMADLMKLVQ